MLTFFIIRACTAMSHISFLKRSLYLRCSDKKWFLKIYLMGLDIISEIVLLLYYARPLCRGSQNLPSHPSVSVLRNRSPVNFFADKPKLVLTDLLIWRNQYFVLRIPSGSLLWPSSLSSKDSIKWRPRADDVSSL